jgi:hypothetical protein
MGKTATEIRMEIVPINSFEDLEKAEGKLVKIIYDRDGKESTVFYNGEDCLPNRYIFVALSNTFKGGDERGFKFGSSNPEEAVVIVYNGRIREFSRGAARVYGGYYEFLYRDSKENKPGYETLKELCLKAGLNGGLN